MSESNPIAEFGNDQIISSYKPPVKKTEVIKFFRNESEKEVRNVWMKLLDEKCISNKKHTVPFSIFKKMVIHFSGE